MAHTALLRLKSKEYNVIACEYEFTQPVKENGQPCGHPVCGLIRITIVSPDDNDLFLHDWMRSATDHKDGEIIFSVVDTGKPSVKTMHFKRGYCVRLRERFDPHANEQMLTRITISAAEISPLSPSVANTSLVTGVVKGNNGMDNKDVNLISGNTLNAKIPAKPKRPSWRQSEIDAAKKHPNHSTQKSFKGGKEVPYGTKGSTRPDLHENGHSIEVKNYKIDNPQGKSRLKKELTRQYNDRVKELPPNTKQTAIIDTRGQNISLKELKNLKNDIQKNAKNLKIIFM